MFAIVSACLGAHLTTRLAHPNKFVAHAFTWFTPVSPTVELAQALMFVTSVLIFTFREVCLLAGLRDLVVHALRGLGVLLVARHAGRLLPHHLPDINTGLDRSWKVYKF